jgi:hypothetical protein
MSSTILIGPDWGGGHKVTIRIRLPTPGLENDLTHVTLRANQDSNVTPLYNNTKLDSSKPKNITIIYQANAAIRRDAPPPKKNLHAVTMRRTFALNGRSAESKHNLEIPVVNRI